MFIGNNWKIETDSLNIVLFKKRTGKSMKTGKQASGEHWGIEGYYSTAKGALIALVNQEIRDTDLKDLQIVVNKIDELYAMIEKLNFTADNL